MKPVSCLLTGGVLITTVYCTPGIRQPLLITYTSKIHSVRYRQNTIHSCSTSACNHHDKVSTSLSSICSKTSTSVLQAGRGHQRWLWLQGPCAAADLMMLPAEEALHCQSGDACCGHFPRTGSHLGTPAPHITHLPQQKLER